jgi:hypothetical protein
MVSTITTGKSGGIEYLETGEDKNRLLSNGEVITRDMLDTRVTLQGDIRATKSLQDSMKNDNYSQDYYHITQSFKENISIEEMKQIVEESESFYLAGYDKSEYNIYTEYHIPKENAKYKLLTATDGDKKYYELLSESEAKEFLEKNPQHKDKLEKRYAHTHTIILRKNFLTNTQLKITEKDERKAINSFQEYINIKYGVESPKDNKRDLTNKQFKNDKFIDEKDNFIDENKKLVAEDFKDLTNAKTKKLITNDIVTQISKENISTYENMTNYLKNQDYITYFEPFKNEKNEYLKIKIEGQKKVVNLRADIFRKDFYENKEVNFDEKVRSIDGKFISDYKKDIEAYKNRRVKEVSKRYDTARAKALKTDLIEKALKDKFESRTITNTNEENIINDLNQGKAVFLTGGAGVGKSFTTNNIIKHFENRGLSVAKLGSTGIASTNINGQTLHSFLEIGIKKDIKELQQFDKNNQERINKLNEKLKNTDLIVIDEISMVSDKQMEMINYRLKNANYQGKLMVVGDFNQLPPVSKDEKVGYAFESKAWKDLKTQTHELTVIKRSDNKEFSQTLNRLRYGYISKEDNQMFLNMQNNKIDESKATYIYSTNKAVQNHNKQKLDALKGKYESYETSFKSEHNLTDVQKDKLLDETPLYKNLEIKKNAPILITANDKNLGVANGDRGVYLGLNENNQMIIKLDRTNKVINIDKKEFNAEIEQDDKLINATIKNYPIRPAYAITTHKSQGMSIDHLAIDPNRQFEKNQFYVAVSRAKDPSKLKILPLDKKYKNNFQNVVKQDNKVLDFYHPTLRSKELKQFDKEVSKRQDLKKEIYFKNLKMKKEQIKEKVIKRSNSSVLKKPRVSIFAKNKQLRQLKKYTRNKVQELRANFKKMKEKYNPIEKLNKIVKYQQEDKNTNKKQAEQNIKQKQLQKTKG